MQLGLYIAAQHPAGSMAEHLERHLEQVRLARDAGFAAVFVNHHYFSNPYQQLHPLPFLGRIAAESRGMRLGVGILLTALLNPVDVCEQATTLDIISGGRFVLGAGLGYRDVEYAAFGVDRRHRVSVFEEGLEVVRRLWTEPAVSFAGERIRLEGVSWPTPPVQRPHPPIWLAANDDPAVRRAARLGDAWLVNPHTRLEVLLRQLEVYREALAAAGRPFPAELPVIRDVFIAESEDAALRLARPYLEAKYRTYLAWGQGEALPADDTLDQPFERLAEGRFLIGGPEEVAAALQELRDRLGATLVLLRLQHPGAREATPQRQVMRAIELVGERVLAAL